ncbi:hypothetical protein FQN57_004997 [Myotisia sp. PD_48]|nr:hypothetical protein FQN57_004997 [Myotisia sp. PD_48]
MLFHLSIIQYVASLQAAKAAVATTVPVPVDGQSKIHRACFDESPALHCYSGGNDIPQNVNVSDVSFIASYLRTYGRQTRIGRLLTMKAADAPNCGEWLLYSTNTAAAYAKKINMTYDSSVLFEDVANTIDGGAGVVKQDGIFRCQTDGGSYGVQANVTAAAYHTPEYVTAGYRTDGIIIKITANV